VVETVSGREITLRESVFYAFSGGQESDSGTIGGIPVANAPISGESIVYTLASDHSLQPEDEVSVAIDWGRRYTLMRLHFAAEIVLCFFMKRFPGIEKIGAHISVNKARIDFKRDEPLTGVLPEIENGTNALIERDESIKSSYSDREKERRYWEIAGFGSIPCGGTHLRSTGEIGRVTLHRKNIGRGKERVEIVLAG